MIELTMGTPVRFKDIPRTPDENRFNQVVRRNGVINGVPITTSHATLVPCYVSEGNHIIYVDSRNLEEPAPRPAGPQLLDLGGPSDVFAGVFPTRDEE